MIDEHEAILGESLTGSSRLSGSSNEKLEAGGCTLSVHLQESPRKPPQSLSKDTDSILPHKNNLPSYVSQILGHSQSLDV